MEFVLRASAIFPSVTEKKARARDHSKIFVTLHHTRPVSVFTIYLGDLEFFELRKSYLSHLIRHLGLVLGLGLGLGLGI